MFEDLSIDTRSFTWRHSPDIRGVFEPVSRIIFLNCTDQEFEHMRQDREDPESQTLFETFWHEAYHCFQTYASGYLYDQRSQLIAILGKEMYTERAIMAKLVFAYLKGKARTAGTVWMPRDLRIAWGKNEATRWEYERLTEISKLSTKNQQPSTVGALSPRLYESLTAVRSTSRIRGGSGLSAQDVIEGSAYVFGKAITYGNDELPSRVADGALEIDGPYRRLITVSEEACPDSPPSLWLAGASLALRYQHPGEAYLPLLQRLNARPREEAMDEARNLARQLPELSAAGKPLGTATELRARMSKRRRRDSSFDDQLSALSGGTWGIDELDLLGTRGVEMVPTGHLGFGVVTLESHRGIGPDDNYRLAIGAMMIPTGSSVVQLRRAFEARIGRSLDDD